MSIRKMIAVAMAAASAILPMASLPSLADVNITEDVVLDAAADWRGQGVVNIAQGATIDLRGHSLRVSGIAGDGTITSDYGITPPAAPSIVTDSSIFWLDAADESTIAMDIYGNVTTWTSKDSGNKVATVRDTNKKPVYRRFAYGRPCVDFGGYNSGVDMTYTQLNNIRTAFFVFKIMKPCFFLNDSTHVNFHRNNNGQYGVAGYFKATVWNGLDAVDLANDILPDDSFQTVVAKMDANSYSDCLTTDRLKSNVDHRSGGRQICEIILFSSALTDEQRVEVTTYLQNKWAAYDAVQTRGDLCVEVAGTAANTSVALSGNLRFVKEGEGTFTAGKTGQNYEGGTVVSNGVLSLANAIGSGYNMPIGQYRSEVHISSNAVFEINGVYNMDMHHFVLDGGTLRNSVAQRNRNGGIGTVALTADSTFDLTENTSFYVGSGVYVDLGGHKLTIALNYKGATAYNYGTCVYTNGLVDIVSGGTFNVNGGTTGVTNVDFRVNCALDITGTLNVRDYTALYSYWYGSGTGAMNVYGTFTPVDANYFYGCTMQNGSTIDLSAKTGAWNSTAKSDANYKRTVEFAPGATVTVNLAGRTLVRGDKIIEWTSHPSGVTFVFDAATAEAGVPPIVTDGGLYYGAEDRVVTIAHWTGAAGDDDVSHAANWACTNAMGREVQNAVPGAYATVHVAGDVAFQLPYAGLLEYVELHIGDITLTADCDWRGLGANFNIDGKIDLNGHKLYLSGVPASGTITSGYGAAAPEAPSIVTDSSIFWLDAADASTIATDASGNVNTWTSKSGDRRVATTQYSSYMPVYKPYEYGRPCVDFGEVYKGTDQNVGVDMTYTAFTDIKTAFFVFKISDWGFFLGGNNFDFHRGGNGIYGLSNYGKMDRIWNGLVEKNKTVDVLPDDSFQIVAVTTKSNCYSDRLCRDNRRNVAQRTGGRQLCEVILFNATLTDEQREEVTTYLQDKWAAYDGADMAELHIDVAQGATVQNSGVAFTDRMKVVKDGAGTFVASKTGQTYVGGTVVTSGTLMPDANNRYVYSTKAFGGAGAVITATTNETSVGTFDMNGNFGMRDIGYVIKLAGGMLKSSFLDIGMTVGQMGHIALEADSTFLVERTCALGVPHPYPTRLDLGGKTLTMNIASGKAFNMSATTVDEGVLVANGPGTLYFGNAYTKNIGIAATNAHFRVNCPILTELNDGVCIDVGTYEALYSGDSNAAASSLRVFDTFKPSAHDRFRGCILMNGATLDLASRTNALPLVSGFASGANTLAFADGATISVRLGDGRFPGGKVISWEAGSAPGNVDTLKFTSVGGERKRQFAVKDDGLYAHVGFLLVIR